MATGGIIELKMKKQYLIGRALLFLGSVCLCVLELTGYSSLDAFFKWGVIVYIAIMLICYYFLLADIYMIKVLDESILFRSLIRTHNVKCSEIDKIYHIKNHYISPRVLVASNAILVVFNHTWVMAGVGSVDWWINEIFFSKNFLHYVTPYSVLIIT